MPRFFVAQVIGLAARIAHRIVAPGSQAELMRVLAPGVGHAVLGNDGAKVRIREHVHPRGRRHLVACSGDDVLAPVVGKAAEPVVEEQIAACGRGRRRDIGTVGSGRRKARDSPFGKVATSNLIRP